MKLMNERGGRVTLADVPTPANNFGEPIEIMQVLLQHEKQVSKPTRCIIAQYTVKQTLTHNEWYRRLHDFYQKLGSGHTAIVLKVSLFNMNFVHQYGM